MRITKNPKWTDEQHIQFTQKVKENDGYCPCRPIHTPETKCMCKDFLEQEDGVCHCGLYVKIKDNN